MVKENGRKMKLIQIATSTKVNTGMTRSTAKEDSIGKVVITILVRTILTRGMDMERCTGLMVKFTKVNG
jgi:hypothetical protein